MLKLEGLLEAARQEVVGEKHEASVVGGTRVVLGQVSIQTTELSTHPEPSGLMD